jgi:DNA-binding LacI/PurR family transcriptional regulator
MKYLRDHKKRIPEDVGVVGIDDMAVSSVISPALTTIRYDYIDIGKKSSELLLKCLNDEKVSNIDVKYEYIERESTKGGNDVR